MVTQSPHIPPKLRRALDRAVQRIVEVAHPETVILFGSYVEGRQTRDSDVDLVVVTPTDDPYELSGELRLEARSAGLTRPMDVLVVTPEEWRHLRDIPGHALNEAFRHGAVLYEAA